MIHTHTRMHSHIGTLTHSHTYTLTHSHIHTFTHTQAHNTLSPFKHTHTSTPCHLTSPHLTSPRLAAPYFVAPYFVASYSGATPVHVPCNMANYIAIQVKHSTYLPHLSRPSTFHTSLCKAFGRKSCPSSIVPQVGVGGA